MSEERAQQIMSQIQMLENYFVDLTQKENSLFTILREANSAIESIKAAIEKSDSETLVPVGMGAYLRSSLSLDEKLILSIGSGVAIEKNKNEAINYLEARIKEIEIAIKETSAQKQQVVSSLEHGKHELNQLVRAARSSQK